LDRCCCLPFGGDRVRYDLVATSDAVISSVERKRFEWSCAQSIGRHYFYDFCRIWADDVVALSRTPLGISRAIRQNPRLGEAPTAGNRPVLAVHSEIRQLGPGVLARRVHAAGGSEIKTLGLKHLMHPFQNPAVAEVFAVCPPGMRRKLLALRRLIFETAAKIDGVGEIEETLKWGEPAYLMAETRSGSTVRVGWNKSNTWR